MTHEQTHHTYSITAPHLGRFTVLWAVLDTVDANKALEIDDSGGFMAWEMVVKKAFD